MKTTEKLRAAISSLPRHPESGEALITAAAAAELVGVTANSIHQLAVRGIIRPAMRLSATTLFEVEAIAAALEAPKARRGRKPAGPAGKGAA